jgi:GH25 family lysozyme M1 (1,4-beta-N-acetylmuramidase)
VIKGVDASSFQGPPADWKSDAGLIDWAGIKFTELGTDGSRYVNPDAAADWAFLHRQGKGRVAYMFGHPGISASASAALFTSECTALKLEDGDAVALDLEVTDGKSAAQVSQWARDVMGLLERDLHRVPIFYTFISFAQEGNCAGLGRYPLWIADPSSPAGSPRVPAPWKTWSVHQYKITGPIDRDVANFHDLTAFRHALGRKKPPVTIREVETDGHESLFELAAKHGTAPSTIIRHTALRDGKFHPDFAAYLNGAGDLRSPMHKGIVLAVPA